MRTYDTYKDSGISWLGQIPSHWDVKRLGSYFTERRQKVSDKDYEPLSVTKQGIFPQLENVAKTNDGDNRKLVRKGDFVINSRSDRKGSSGVSELDGSVSLINIVLEPHQSIIPAFCNFLLKSHGFIEEYYRIGRGIVADLWTTRYQEMKFMPLAVPPLAEQEAIVAYLDSATAEIDKAIASQQRMVELLQERKQIIINQAVTQGLNPDAPMKPTDIDWLPQIPAHWDLRRLKYVSQDYKAGPFGSSLITSELNTNGSILVYTPEHIANQSTDIEGNLYLPESRRNEMSQFFIKPGDIIFPIVGSLGRAMIIQKWMPTGIINQRLAKFNIKSCYLNNDYFMWLFAYSTVYNDYIILTQRGSIIVNLTKGIIGNIPIPLPSLEEQKRIVSHIIESTKPINAAISRCERKIELLTERKQILINEVVTGKINIMY